MRLQLSSSRRQLSGNLFLATGVGNFLSWAGCGGGGVFQHFDGVCVAILFDQVVAVKVVRINAIWVDGERLYEHFSGFVVVTKSHWPAGYLVIETAQTGVCRALQRLWVDRHRRFKAQLGAFTQR